MDLRRIHMYTSHSKPSVFEHVARWKNHKIVLPVKRILLREKAIVSDGYIRVRPIYLSDRLLCNLSRVAGLPSPYKIYIHDRLESAAVKTKNGIVYNAGELIVQFYAEV
jgi:hypothetical protein